MGLARFLPLLEPAWRGNVMGQAESWGRQALRAAASCPSPRLYCPASSGPHSGGGHHSGSGQPLQQALQLNPA